MAKLGAVIGPWPGTFWLDVASCELVVHEGREGIAAEVRVPVSPEKFAELAEGLMVEPVSLAPERPAPVAAPAPLYEQPPAPRKTERELRAEKRAQRPTSIRCGRCRLPVEVRTYGKVPTLCADCRPYHQGQQRADVPRLSKIAEIESARRGA